MIEPIECIIIKCNHCGEIFEDGHGFTIFPDYTTTNPEDYGWHVDEGKHYCPGCHEVDENDNLIIKTESDE